MPKVLSGLMIYTVSFLLFICPYPAYGKGLQTEELGNTVKEQIAQYAKNVKDHPDDDDIAFAESQKLIAINHVKSFEALKDLYATGSEKVKAKIIKAIGQQRNYAIDAANDYWILLQQALESTSEGLSGEIVTSLARLESEAFFNKLFDRLKTDKSSKAMTGNIVKVLCMFIHNGSDELTLATSTLGVRIAAVKVLLGKGDAANAKCLVDALEKKLGEDFSEPEAVEQWWQKNQEKSIAKILDEANRKIQQRATIEARKKQEYRTKYIEQLIDNFKKTLALDPKKAAAKFLIELADPNAEPEVLIFLMKELGRLKIKDAYEPIRSRLKSDNVQVRIAAIESIGEIGNIKALGEVAEKVKAERLDERLAAVKTIARLGGVQAAQTLLEALKTEKELAAQQAIVKGLGQVGLTVAVVPLVNVLAIVSEGNLKLRDTATNDSLRDVADALGNILQSSENCKEEDRNLAIDYMLAMLAVSNDTVKYTAIKNLGNIGAQRATSVLVDVLKKDINSGIRKEAARALGKMPETSSDVEGVLLSGLKDKEKEVQEACMWALRNIAGLNGSHKEINLALLLKLSSGLQGEETYHNVRSLLKNLPELKDLKPANKKNKDSLYELRGILADAHMKANDFKAAAAELEKVVAYFKEPLDKAITYRDMLARVYVALGQLTKAVDEYGRLIKIDAQQTERCLKEILGLIKKIGDDKEKLKRIEAALQFNPPQEIKAELERMKQELTAKIPKEPETP